MTDEGHTEREGWVRLEEVPSIPRPPVEEKLEVRIVPLPEFSGVDEPGVEAILGTLNQNLIPVGGDLMLYGDGGAGKTTLAIDLAFHLAAGLDWLGIQVEKPRSILLIENEGPRPLFRRKLRLRLEAWDGPPLEDRLHVWEDPWAGFSFTEQEMRAQLAQAIFEREIDLLIAGPVTQLGMEDAGTIREVRHFAEHVALVRERSLRPVASMLVHHEAKSGRVSGAWEGVGDTLLHVSGSGHGRTRVGIQKARWSPSHHSTTMHLRWTSEGQSFELDNDDETRPVRVFDGILDYVRANPGVGWTEVEKTVKGEKGYIARRRDQMIKEGDLIDLGKGEIGKGHRYELWLPEAAPQTLPLVPGPRNGDSGDKWTPSGERNLDGESPRPRPLKGGDSPATDSPPAQKAASPSPDLDSDIDW